MLPDVIEILSSSSDDDYDQYKLSQNSQRRSLNVNFNESDLETLSGCNWLNDSIVNSYINLMKSYVSTNIGMTNSFFYSKLLRDGCEAASVWEGIKGRNLNEYNLFLIPICTGCHWILIALDFVNEELNILDSLGSLCEKEAQNINNFLKWQGISPLHIIQLEVPQQNNGYDRGVFLLQNIRCILFNNWNFDFDQIDIPQIRDRIKSELTNCTLELN